MKYKSMERTKNKNKTNEVLLMVVEKSHNRTLKRIHPKPGKLFLLITKLIRKAYTATSRILKGHEDNKPL